MSAAPVGVLHGQNLHPFPNLEKLALTIIDNSTIQHSVATMEVPTNHPLLVAGFSEENKGVGLGVDLLLNTK
jgi:hypothetical protein